MEAIAALEQVKHEVLERKEQAYKRVFSPQRKPCLIDIERSVDKAIMLEMEGLAEHIDLMINNLEDIERERSVSS